MKNHLTLLFIITIGFSAVAQPVHLMTYNIRYANENDGENIWDNRKDKIVKMINYYEPGIVGIQEGLLKQVEYLDKSLKDFNFVGVGREDGKKQGEYAAIFYNKKKYKVMENTTFWLSETPEKVSVGWDAALERICTYALFKDKQTGKTFWVFNTHFDHRGDQARVNSAKLILEMINKKTDLSKHPVVLMGDLNLTPEKEGIQTLKSQLSDSKMISEKEPYGPIGTSNGFDTSRIMTGRIDYIFVKNLKVKQYAQLNDRRDNNLYPSDHIPVLIEAYGF
ncbi:endonuclease/exonuclease/phosphatase family protein [Reichenbachiella sp. MALMAid0571]|uniref:endonuclease/exonuclease/phosphatase family protein n=1 Tax=Reichenbachiella sp. MALMAid0571 TaxID=3143939 RepID=UPI0032DFAFC2